MEEVDQELTKHMCKLCNKSFPCGRSLGGHMKSHVINSNDHDKVKKISCLSVLDKICKECGKGFQSWKALFGHMKCHSTKPLNNKSKNIASLNQDNQNSEKNTRIKMSRLRNKRKERYVVPSNTTAITSSSSISMNASTSMMSEEIEQEQEVDVAMSLMMLSKEMWKRGDGFESYKDYNSSVMVNLSNVEVKDFNQNDSKTKKFDYFGRSEVGWIKSYEIDSGFGEFEDSGKRKFDCITCNKSFHSRQALGGHKASHKKLKGDFDWKFLNETKIEGNPMLDHDQRTNGYDLKTSSDHQASSNFNLDVGCLNKKKAVLGPHECQICSKTFSSGQALGGHKRAHMIFEGKMNQENNNRVIKKHGEQVCESRGFLDLNMPPDEEEMNMSSGITEYKSYYGEDSSDHHSHELRLLGDHAASGASGILIATSEGVSKPQPLPSVAFQCELCKISCSGNELLKMHISGKKHQKKLKELVQLPDPPLTPIASLETPATKPKENPEST